MAAVPDTAPVRAHARHDVNAMTIDVEDYFHVSAFATRLDRANWPKFESRVEHNTHRLLDLFASTRARTFFVLGWVAERHPELIRELHRRGHEVACHGLTHELVYKQTPEVFRDETQRSQGAARGSQRRRRARLSRGQLFDHARVVLGARYPRRARVRVRLEHLSRSITTPTASRTRRASRTRSARVAAARSAADDRAVRWPAPAVRRRRVLPPAAVRVVPLGPAAREPRRHARGVSICIPGKSIPASRASRRR